MFSFHNNYFPIAAIIILSKVKWHSLPHLIVVHADGGGSVRHGGVVLVTHFQREVSRASHTLPVPRGEGQMVYLLLLPVQHGGGAQAVAGPVRLVN